MFGLKALFAALGRLTAAVTRSAELFESANQHLEQQLGFAGEPANQLPHEPASETVPARRNGRK